MGEPNLGRQWFIYSLVDPFSGEIRYIGKTHKSLTRRLGNHISCAINGHTTTPSGDWIRQLHNDAERPIMRLLLTGHGNGWQNAEKYWISFLLGSGADLLNVTAGGGGCLGAKRSEETKSRMRKHRADNPWTPEMVQRHRSGLIRANAQPETKALRSAAFKKIWQDPDIRRRMLHNINTPENKQKRRVAIEKINSERRDSTEYREAMAKSTKSLWENPAKREEMRIKIRQALNSPDIKRRHVDAIIKAHAEPGRRDKSIEACKKQRASETEEAKMRRRTAYALTVNTPEHKKMHRDACKAAQSRPEVRERNSARMRRIWEERREERNLNNPLLNDSSCGKVIHAGI